MSEGTAPPPLGLGHFTFLDLPPQELVRLAARVQRLWAEGRIARRARVVGHKFGLTSRDMLFEQIPAYLEFFGLPSTTPDELRRLARVTY